MKVVKNHLPIALSVNKESRAEALRHYAIIPRTNQKHPTTFAQSVNMHRCDRRIVRMPFCFGLKVDTTSYFFSAFNVQYKLLESINEQAPKLFPDIKKLELLCGVSTVSDDYKLWPEQPAGLLLRMFPAVEMVLFTVRNCPRLIRGKEEVVKIKENTAAWLEGWVKGGRKRSEGAGEDS
jgi:hypothetical protein